MDNGANSREDSGSKRHHRLGYSREEHQVELSWVGLKHLVASVGLEWCLEKKE